MPFSNGFKSCGLDKLINELITEVAFESKELCYLSTSGEYFFAIVYTILSRQLTTYYFVTFLYCNDRRSQLSTCTLAVLCLGAWLIW